MTDDYDEQTKIRGVSSTMNGFVYLRRMCVPDPLYRIVWRHGVSDTLCWTMAAGCIGVISIIFGLINYFSIKNVKFIEKAIDQEPENILKTYKDILKLKSDEILYSVGILLSVWICDGFGQYQLSVDLFSGS